MMNFFEANYKPSEIITFCDISFSPDSNSSVYKKIGMNLVGDSSPGYYWVVDGMRSHRLNHTKHKLVKEGASPELTETEIMYTKKSFRIWDCGNYKYIKTFF